jgi:tetratricopeptide (TPR) repeat protein
MQWLIKGFKLFLTILFMLSCAFAFTQETDKQKKLNELLDQAYETVDSSRDSALTILNNAEEIALDIKDTGALIFIYNNVGRIYIDKSQYENASVAYRDALSILKPMDTNLGLAMRLLV